MQNTPDMFSCSIYKDVGVGVMINGLWYAAAYEANIPEIMNIHNLAQLRKNMHRCHPPLDNRSKRAGILRSYCESEPDTNPIKIHLIEALQNRELLAKIKATLSEPTFEALKILKLSGLPNKGDVVFSSTATANSGNDDAMTSALAILGVSDGITYHRSSTVNSTGLTGVSNLQPKNPVVQFDEHCKWGSWATMVRSLALQFLKVSYNYTNGSNPEFRHKNQIFDIPYLANNEDMPDSLQVDPIYDKLYHWGCISQPWETNLLGNHISQWEIHEEWNVNMTIAMMWHAVISAKPGAQICLKIRIFKRAETLGLTTIFSNLFDNVILTENSRQTCYFAVGIFNGMTNDMKVRKHVAKVLWKAMDQHPEHIFQDPLMASEKSKKILPLCTELRRNMVTSLCKSNSVFLVGLRILMKCLQDNSADEFHIRYTPLLQKLYTKETSEYFLSEWIKCFIKLSNTDAFVLKKIMYSPWMRDVC